MQEIFDNLTTFIKESNNVIIMTHSNIDLDGISSSICLYEIIKSFKTNVYIYLNKKITNKAVNNVLDKLQESRYNINYIYDDTYKNIKDFSLIILDTNKIDLIENPDILNFTDNIVVIDHHMKSTNYIINTKLSYINANLSSIAEFMTGYILYLNKKISPLLSTILLSAIAIDTNNFTVKTTSSTHQKASKLLDLGANNIEVNEILKENKDEYLKRQDLIKNAYVVNNIAICVFDDLIYKKEDLAITSQELISFEDIEAGFTIGKISKKEIGISARSIGNIDVCEIMKKLNGGGHFTEAACVLKNSNLEEAHSKLMEVLHESNIC